MYVLRRHPITFIPKILLFLVLLSVPFLLFFIFREAFSEILENPIASTTLILGASAYTLGIILFFYTIFTTFYLDVSIVTNDRIVDIQQHGLFSRVSSEMDLFRIQDVTAEVKGVFATFFDYGTVYVQTASNHAPLIMNDISHPNHIRDSLIELSHEDRKYHNIQAE